MIRLGKLDLTTSLLLGILGQSYESHSYARQRKVHVVLFQYIKSSIPGILREPKTYILTFKDFLLMHTCVLYWSWLLMKPINLSPATTSRPRVRPLIVSTWRYLMRILQGSDYDPTAKGCKHLLLPFIIPNQIGLGIKNQDQILFFKEEGSWIKI